MKTIKFSRVIPALGVCSILAAANQVQATTIVGNVSDTHVYVTGAGDQGSGTFVTQVATDPIRAGRASSRNYSAVFAFQLPNLGAVSNPFVSSSLGLNLESNSGSYNADLYGLSARAASSVLDADFYFGSADGSANATFLQDSFLTTSTAVGSVTSSDITTWLNAQYASGAGADQYVFLRVSPDVNSAIFTATNGFTITSANAGSNQPFLSYTIPEPSSTVLIAGVFGMALLRRRRR